MSEFAPVVFTGLQHPILEEVEVTNSLHDTVPPAADSGPAVRRLSFTTVVVVRFLQGIIRNAADLLWMGWLRISSASYGELF